MKKLLLIAALLVTTSLTAVAQNGTKALDEGAGSPVIPPIPYGGRDTSVPYTPSSPVPPDPVEAKPRAPTAPHTLPMFMDSPPADTSYNLKEAEEEFDHANKIVVANVDDNKLSCGDMRNVADLYAYAAKQYTIAGVEAKAQVAKDRGNALVAEANRWKSAGKCDGTSLGPDTLANYRQWFQHSSTAAKPQPAQKSEAEIEAYRAALLDRLKKATERNKLQPAQKPNAESEALRKRLRESLETKKDISKDISNMCAYMKRVGLAELNGVVTNRDCLDADTPNELPDSNRDASVQPQQQPEIPANPTPGGVTGGRNTGIMNPADPAGRGGNHAVPTDPKSRQSTIKGPIRPENLQSGGPAFLGGASSPPPSKSLGGVNVGGGTITKGAPTDLSIMRDKVIELNRSPQ